MPVPSTPSRGVRALEAADLAYMYIDEAAAEAHGMLRSGSGSRGRLGARHRRSCAMRKGKQVTSVAIIAASERTFKPREQGRPLRATRRKFDCAERKHMPSVIITSDAQADPDSPPGCGCMPLDARTGDSR